MTRAEWLERVCGRAMATRPDIYAKVDLDLVDFDTAYTSQGKRSGLYGEAFANEPEGGGKAQIIMSGVHTDPFEIAVTVCHELLHIECGDVGHGGTFRTKSLALGVDDPKYWADQSDEFKAWIEDLISDAGPMPIRPSLPGGKPKVARTKLPKPDATESEEPEGISSAPPKQSTRMLKLECGECGFICRTTAKWVRDVMRCPYPECSGSLNREPDKTENEDGRL